MQGKAQFGPYEVKEKSEFIFASSDRFDEQVDRLRALRFGKFKYIRNFNPDISNAMAVSYREQMPMMQYLNQLWEAQELEPNAAAWFKTPKPKEELYNLFKAGDEVVIKETDEVGTIKVLGTNYVIVQLGL